MSLLRPYIDLMKLRVVELLIITTLPAMVLAEKGLPSFGLVAATLMGGTLAAGASNAFNMVIESESDITLLPGNLNFPLFVKPAKAGDSLGVDNASKANNIEELTIKVKNILSEFGSALVEEYIDGREFTVIVCGNPDGKTCTSFTPDEYIFPEGIAFIT